MWKDIFSNTLSEIVGEIFGETIEDKLRLRKIDRVLNKAVENASANFAKEHSKVDSELVVTLTEHTRFDDLSGVKAAMREMITHPFHPTDNYVEYLRKTFMDVLPDNILQERIDSALVCFLNELTREVLTIAELRDLFALVFQKESATSSQLTAENTAFLVEGVSQMAANFERLPEQLAKIARNQLPFGEINKQESLTIKSNLPVRDYFELIGRSEEIAQLQDLLRPYPKSRHFLITLDGIGGVGKSALALEAAYNALEMSRLNGDSKDSFKAIVWITAKREILTSSGIRPRQHAFSTLSDLYREIANVLEKPDILKFDIEGQRAAINNLLASHRTLLILDNLETVEDDELLSFLRYLPDPTKAIVTTRHRIDVAYPLRLQGLTKETTMQLIDLEASNRLIDLDERHRNELAKLSAGVPLAIIWTLSLISRGHRRDVAIKKLANGKSNIAAFCFSESVKTLRETRALDVLYYLSFFDSSVSLKMIEAASHLHDEIELDSALADLIQLSLINRRLGRYNMLPLTRAFAREHVRSNESDYKVKLGMWIHALSEFAEPFNAVRWRWHDLSELYREGQHLVTLAKWSENNNRPDIYLRTVSALNFYFNYTGQWPEKNEVLSKGLSYAMLVGDQVAQFMIYRHQAGLFSQRGEYERSLQAISNSHKIAVRLVRLDMQIKALISWSGMLRRLEDHEGALEMCDDASALIDRLTSEQQIAVRASLLYEQGKIYRDLKQWHEARISFIEARDVFGFDPVSGEFDINRAWGLLGNLGFIEYALKNYDESRKIYEQCIAHIRISGGQEGLATLLTRLAILEMECGNHDAALKHATEARAISERLSLIKELEQAKAIIQQVN